LLDAYELNSDKKLLETARSTCNFILQDLTKEITDYDNGFDLIVSMETFEHVKREDVPTMLENFKRMCKSGGLVFFTCATTGRKEHGTSRSDSGSSPLTVNIGWEYYRNLDEDDFRESFKESFDEIFSEYEFHSTVDYDNPTELIKSMRSYINPCEDLYFWGIKK